MLNRVIKEGLDPTTTEVSEMMTPDSVYLEHTD
jgi:hypothetical protein